MANSGAQARSTPKWLWPAVAYSLAIGSLIWVFQGVELKSILEDLRRMDWHWIGLAFAAEIAIYFLQGWRWVALLRPVARVPYGAAVRAVYIGIFANEVLPLRTGELIRCYLLARWASIPFSKVLSSMVIERVIDGVLICVAFYALSSQVAMPGFIEQMTRILAIGVVVAIIFLIVLRANARFERFLAQYRWLSFLEHLVEAMRDMGDWRTIARTTAISIPYLVIQVIPFWALGQNLNLNLSFAAMFLVLLIVRIGTIVPQAPGNVGVFQFLVVTALALFGLPKQTSASFSVLMFGLITLPLLAAGAVALASTGIRLSDIGKHGEEEQKAEPVVETAGD